MHIRIITAVLIVGLMIPLIPPQSNPRREQERKTLLFLIGLTAALTILLGFLKRMI